MSSVSLICIGFLLFVAINGANIHQKDAPRRFRRSLTKLNYMLGDITGREGTEFINYGNWCGLGGSGEPIDPLDGCCQNHDICYDEITKTACSKYEKKSVYNINYEWKKDKDVATCEENPDVCSAAVCLCDVILTNCLKDNVQYYDAKNIHKMSIYEMIEQGNYIANM